MIERRIREASDLWFPPTPPLAASALLRLPAARSPSRRLPWRVLVPALVAVALTGAAFAATALELVPGVRIQRVERLPEVALSQPRLYGRETTVEAAHRAAGFTLLLPQGRGLDPGRIYLDRDGSGAPVVTAVYGDEERARLVLTQWVAGPVLFDKLLGFQGRARYVDVHGAPGIWIDGPDHEVFYLGTTGREERIAGFLAGNVLVWQRGSVSYRLEADVSRRRALELAGSLRSR